MTVLETRQALDLITYAHKTGYTELPQIVSDSIAKIRKVFANTITTDLEKPLEEQINALIKACKENNIEVVNEDLFCYNEFETLRISHEFNNPTTNETGEILVDVYITTDKHEFYNAEKDTEEENEILICPDYADVVLSINEQQGDIIFQDIVGNQLAKLVKGDNVRLQVNYCTVMEDGKTFVYDGCHKLYIISSEEQREYARELGYIVEGSKEDSEMEHPISELEEYYLNSCPLRFIQTFGTKSGGNMINILPQGADLPMFIYY